MGDATVESLLSQALGSLSFAVSNIERGIDGNALAHIKDAKRDIRAALRSDSPVSEPEEYHDYEQGFDDGWWKGLAEGKGLIPEGAVPVEILQHKRDPVAYTIIEAVGHEQRFVSVKDGPYWLIPRTDPNGGDE